MKKLNNKGMTLVELIVSFAIVTVAVVYFSQSLITTSKLFKNTKEETDEYVNEVYIYRTLEAMFEEYSENSQIGIEQSMWFLGFMNFGVYCDVDESNMEELLNKDPSAVYKLHKIGTIQVDYQKLRGTCSAFSGDWAKVLDTDLGSTPDTFKSANIWIPMNYYEIPEDSGNILDIEWFTGNKVKTYNAKKIDGNKFEIKQIKNFYNPKLELFLSMAVVGEGENQKVYKYMTSFDYSEFKSNGGTVIYVIQNDWFVKIKELFNGGIWDSLSQFITNMVSKLGDAFDINGFISNIKFDSAIDDIFSGIANVIEKGGQDAKEAALGFVAAIGDAFEELSDGAKESISKFSDDMKETFEDLGEAADKAGDFIEEGWNKFIELF